MAVAVASVAFALLGPLTDLIANHDVQSLPQLQRAAHLPDARATVRTQVLTLGAGLFAVGALLFTARNFILSRRMYSLTEQGQVTDRFTKAIEQLGSDKLEVRLGGIYALERVARDSARDHPTVVDVLCAFIRERAGEPGPVSPASEDGGFRTRADVQAAISVLGRRDTEQDVRRYVKQEGTWLFSQVSTTEIRTPLQLAGANLAGADIVYADLSKADLRGANFIGANLGHADLSRADLTDANFTRAVLSDADLSRADLIRANLTGANLSHADLSGANLTEANLSGAGFLDTDITSVDLSLATKPQEEPAPKGWERDPLNAETGQLRRAETRTETAEAH
jgi:hypothetical protein